MSDILELTDKNYSTFMESTDKTVFIDFYSDTCPPCQTLMTYLEPLAKHYKEDSLVITKVNVGENPKLASKFMVRSVPLTILIGKDKMVKKAENGLLSIDGYYKMIDKELGKNKGFFSKLFGKKEKI
jgi:thioredoxin 1